jgi:hypothetical protein
MDIDSSTVATKECVAALSGVSAWSEFDGTLGGPIATRESESHRVHSHTWRRTWITRHQAGGGFFQVLSWQQCDLAMGEYGVAGVEFKAMKAKQTRKKKRPASSSKAKGRKQTTPVSTLLSVFGDEAKLKCKICPDMGFLNVLELVRHVDEHSSLASKCAYMHCAAAFATGEDLDKHMKWHGTDDPDRPFKCDKPGCFKAYTQSSTLSQHRRNVHGVVSKRALNAASGGASDASSAKRKKTTDSSTSSTSSTQPLSSSSSSHRAAESRSPQLMPQTQAAPSTPTPTPNGKPKRRAPADIERDHACAACASVGETKAYGSRQALVHHLKVKHPGWKRK